MTDPYREPPALAALRFALEVVAWIALYFGFGWPYAVLAIAVLSVFSVRGDKHKVIVAVPGKLRILLELAVFIAGAFAVERVWSFPSVGIYVFAVAVMFASSHRRMMFLWRS